jgi:hypothetical protein
VGGMEGGGNTVMIATTNDIIQQFLNNSEPEETMIEAQVENVVENKEEDKPEE